MQLKYHMVTIEDLVPQEHFLRKLEHVLDMSFVQEETAHLYSRKYGRPPIDPVVMVKYLLVGFLYGIPSERQIEQRIQTDVALRWYLVLDLFDRAPDHSTISQLRRRKPSFRKVFRRLFEEVVRQCVEKGLVSGRMVVTDSTHMKANAAVSSEELVEIKEAPGVYWERLDAYEEEGLEKLKEKTGKRRKKRVKQIKKTIRRSHKRVSHTDPDAGHMKRPGKPEGPQYLVHEATDSDNGFIVDVVVTGGDSSDSAPYLDQIERINKNVVPIQAAAADSAYNVPMFYRALKDLGIDFYVPPRKNNDCTKAEFKHKDFAYEKETDSYLCPAGKRLELHGLNRTVSGLNWSYKADRKDCDACPFRQKCLNMHAPARIIEHSYFYDPAWDGKGHVDEPARREALKRRLIWCEGTFSAQKRSHNLRQIFRRGLEAAEDHGLLSAAALNLKRLIKCLG